MRACLLVTCQHPNSFGFLTTFIEWQPYTDELLKPKHACTEVSKSVSLGSSVPPENGAEAFLRRMNYRGMLAKAYSVA